MCLCSGALRYRYQIEQIYTNNWRKMLPLKVNSEKNDFEVSKPNIRYFTQKQIIFFVISCKLIGGKRSNKQFWKKQMWLKASYYLFFFSFSRNSTLSIHTWKIICNQFYIIIIIIIIIIYKSTFYNLNRRFFKKSNLGLWRKLGLLNFMAKSTTGIAYVVA